MNKRMIIYILGKMLGVEGVVLLIPAFVSLLYWEKSGFSFLIVSAILGIVFLIYGRNGGPTAGTCPRFTPLCG